MKSIRTIPLEGHPIKFLTSTRQNRHGQKKKQKTVMVIKSKESLNNCHSQEDSKET